MGGGGEGNLKEDVAIAGISRRHFSIKPQGTEWIVG